MKSKISRRNVFEIISGEKLKKKLHLITKDVKHKNKRFTIKVEKLESQ